LLKILLGHSNSELPFVALTTKVAPGIVGIPNAQMQLKFTNLTNYTIYKILAMPLCTQGKTGVTQ
jgi:hypothetical protein